MRMDLTLDIPDVQIVVNYPGDGDGFFWHHRILLHRIEGAQWLTLSPDHEVVRHDLNAIPHRVLMTRAMFPQDIAHEVYAHDPIGLATLQNFKRQARIQATILGEGDVGEPESFQWLIAEVGHARFGQEIDEMLLSDGATGLAFSQKGVAILDGEEIYVEKVMAKDLESWKKRKGLELGDMRLLGDHKDAAGKRRLDLNSAVELMKGGGDDETESDFPIQGTRAAKEYHQAVALGTNGFLAYHEQWLRQSGVQKRASAAHIHRNLCEGLRLLHSWDQVDGSTTAIGEHLSRWAIQTELAVERNPAQPDVDQHCWVTAGPRLRNSESGSHLNSKKEARSGSKNDCMPKSDNKPKVVGRDLDGTIMTLTMMPVSGRRRRSRRTKVARGG